MPALTKCYGIICTKLPLLPQQLGSLVLDVVATLGMSHFPLLLSTLSKYFFNKVNKTQTFPL